MAAVVKLLRRIVDTSSDCFYSLLYRNEARRLPPVSNTILLESASSLSAKIRNGKLTSQEVVQAFIDQAKIAHNFLNCIVDERFADALNEAKKIDEYLASAKSQVNDSVFTEKPFLGVPFTVKNSFNVKGLINSAGVYAWKDRRADSTADAVDLMCKSGAILLAITNTSEFCMWWESSNRAHGQTCNPYDLSRSPGGSSGGEAALLAASGSPMGIGNDIGGSIRIPCSFCGIFGHKPSSGQVTHADGEFDSFLATGPMSRFVCDLSPMLKILAAENYSKLKLDAKLRYFFMEDDGSAFISSIHPHVRNTLHQVVCHLANACDKEVLKDQDFNLVLEFLKCTVNKSQYSLPIMMLMLIEKSYRSDASVYEAVHKSVHELRVQLENLLGTDGVLLCPALPHPAVYHNQSLLMPFNPIPYSGIFNILGFPSTQVPISFTEHGLPVGIQVISQCGNDHLCLAVATELEHAFGGWRPPMNVL